MTAVNRQQAVQHGIQMAYSRPTAADLKARYPAFATVSDDVVLYWIADAEAVVDAGWSDTWRATGVMAHAAHRMAELGVLTGTLPPGVTSFKSGTFSATVADAYASLTGFKSTPYGRDFLSIRRRLFAGPRVVNR